MTSSRRRVWLWGLAAILAVALTLGGYTVYWQQVAKQLQAGVEQWAAEQRSAGATIDFKWDGISGFPFAFTADFTGVSILGRLGATALSARTDHLQLNMSPIDLQRVRLLCDSPLTVIIPGLSLGQAGAADGDATATGTRLTLDQADGSIQLRNGNPAGVTIDVNRGKLDNGQDVLSAASLHVDVQLPPTPPRDFKDPAAMFAIAASNVALPADMPQLLPGPITQFDITGTIKGPLLPPGGTPPQDLASALSQWSTPGGDIELSRFDYAQGPVAMTGTGTLALDANLQPVGAGTITATGLGDLIDLLAARGAIHHKDAGIAKAVIEGLQKPGANGRPEVTIGLTIQDRVVSFGFAKLFKLPPINWP
ncbi:MAG TPA: DUF2125 domain-containing protein [Dongiaceae bacterium]|nr:DUF2125 domain-containing protein [Dongiaceae bacterium]